MKTVHFLILTIVMAVGLVARAQTYDPDTVTSVDPNPDLQPVTNFVGSSGQLLSGSPAYAEAITPDIQALADGLQDDPLKIFKYVHDHIRYVLYMGSVKGAELTLLEQSGNDFDQCALLSALLQAAGYSPTYQFSMIEYPYSATDGTHNDLQHWWQMSLPNTNWTATYTAVTYLAGNRGYGVMQDQGDNNDVAFQRIWVTVAIGGTNYLLDPAFKVSEPVSGINLAAAMGFSSNAVMSAAGGVDTGNYVSNLDEVNLRATLTGYTTNLLNYLQSNAPNASVEQILGGSAIVPYTNADFSQAMIFTNEINPSGLYPAQSWTNEPTSFMSSLSVTIGSSNQTWYFPQLEGQPLSVSYNGSGVAQLWLGNSNILQASGSTVTNVTLSAINPYGGWSVGNNAPSDSGHYDQTASRWFQNTSANYAILYGFDPSVKWLNQMEQQLDVYRSAGYTNGSTQIVDATLNVMGMQWLVQTRLAQNILCQQTGILPMFYHRVGRMGQESGHGIT